jgi:ribonuclease BN (tRNA processing enzyme)
MWKNAPGKNSRRQPESDPHMRVTILGSGTCVPSLARSSCAVLVEGAGSTLLLDAGVGTLRRMLETGVTIFDITHIFFSHFHPDHTAELVPFLFASKYPEQTRRQTPLVVIAGKGFGAFFQGLSAVYGDWIQLPDELMRIIELDTDAADSFQIDGLRLDTRPVIHRPESLAVRVAGAGGKSMVYSGDTDLSPDLVALAAGADLLICECSHPDDMKIQGHLTPSLAGSMARQAGVAKLVLTHFYPDCDAVDIAGQCRRTYSGPLVLARDLMRFEL